MIYQRGKKNTYWYRFRFGGRTIHESARTRSKTIARDAERQRRRELEYKWNKLEQRALPPTFSSAATNWLEDRKPRLATSTVETYSVALTHLRRHFHILMICDITTADIARYQDSRVAAGAASATVNKEITCLGSILNRHGLWSSLRGAVKMLKEAEVGTALDERQESDLLLQASRVGNVGHKQGNWSPIYTVTQLGLNTGLRHSEIRRLRWQDIDLRRRLLRVGESKTKAGTGRFVPLNEPTWAALETWAARFQAHSPSQFVFPSCENGILRPERPIANWRSAWRTVCRAAGLPGLRFHDLRHTATTKLLEHGVPYATVAQILGWSASTAVRMAKRYGHIRPDAQRRALEAIATHDFGVGVHQIDNQISSLVKSGSQKSLKTLV